MSSTRYQSPGSDPDDANERFLSDPAFAGINIGLYSICIAARQRTLQQTRAMVWLHNFARLMQVTADQLCAELDFTRTEIRHALTAPHFEHQVRFTEKVLALRADYESKLPVPCTNRVSHAVRRAMREGHEDRVFSILIGPERIGKSTPLLDEYLRNYMDRGLFARCPESRDMRSFMASLAAPAGIAFNASKKADALRAQLMQVLSTGVIEMISMDEMQFAWPSDLQNSFPERIEFFRAAWDMNEIIRKARRGYHGGGGLGIIGAVTPQFEDDMNKALDVNRRWKPGQFEGRMRRTHTPDTLNRREVADIASSMAGDFPESALELLVNLTLASPGLLGFLDNVVGKTRFNAKEDKLPITPELVERSAREMLKGSKVEKAAKARAAKKGLNA